MLLSAVSVLVFAQSSSEIPQGLMNNPVYVTACSDCRITEDMQAVRHSGWLREAYQSFRTRQTVKIFTDFYQTQWHVNLFFQLSTVHNIAQHISFNSIPITTFRLQTRTHFLV